MISGDNVTLKPPLCVIDEHMDGNEEVDSLLESITSFFSQCNMIHFADLTVSNNEWVELDGCRKRVDFTFPLNSLVKLEVYPERLVFCLLDGSVHSVDVGKDFFWFFDWESSYYD